MDRLTRSVVKGIYVASCCGAAAAFIRHIHDSRGANDAGIAITGGVALFVVTLIAMTMGARGKQSASWLTLACGSWLTIDIMAYLGLFLATPWSFWSGLTLILLTACVWGGMRAASRGKWTNVLCWWLGSSVLVFCFSFWSMFKYR